MLPPIAVLEGKDVMYHFVSGFTAKLAGTEVGVTEPQAAFSACFGAPFMAHKPSVYAKLLRAKMEKHHARCILLNTGWSGGRYGVGKRISIKDTRALLNAALSGQLDKVECEVHPIFNLKMPKSCPGVRREDPQPAQHLDRQGGLRRGREQAARHVPQELRREEVRGTRHRAGDVTRMSPAIDNYKAGLACFGKNQFAEAIAEFQKALAERPELARRAARAGDGAEQVGRPGRGAGDDRSA